MQRTTFPFEVLIYDDASTDRTPQIIQDYKNKYPEIFKVTLYKENNFSKGLGYVGLYDGITLAKGKYVAYCEGDDYWIDPNKLQKQVDFLEAHPNYEICAHEVRILSNDNKQNKEHLFSQFEKNIFIPVTRHHYNFDDMLTGNIYHISSMMYRNFPITLPQWINKVSACDMVLFRLLGERGELYIMNDVMSVYRTRIDSLTNSNKEYQSTVRYYTALSIPVLRLLNLYWNRKYQEKIYPIIARYYVRIEFIYLSKSARNYSKALQIAIIAYKYSWRSCLKYQFIELYYKLKKHLS